MPTFRVLTLGCKVNQYETEYVREGLLRLGYREAKDGEPADWCVVNTCTVTGESDLKSRKVIRQLARQNPQAKTVVMGCYATRAPEVVAALPGVVEVVTDKRRLPELLARFGLAEAPDGISSFGQRHRAYVKVQDGCRMSCAYCIIPKVRPVLSSRPLDEVIGEIHRLAANGYREIVLTGIHLGHYGVHGEWRVESGESSETSDAIPDSPFTTHHSSLATHHSPLTTHHSPLTTLQSPLTLAHLVGQNVRLDGEFRVRISSIEAVEIGPELLALMAEYPDRVCPHLHVSMQSGSDAVLRRMGRRWAGARFIQRCQAIRESLDHPALTTDVIVGFPGETEADFEATCRAVEEVGFSKLHVFRFSPRPGTPAAEMPDHLPGNVKKRRAEQLAQIGRRLRERFLASLAGRPLQVLVERPIPGRPGMLAGTSARYAPVELPGSEACVGQLVHATAGSVVDGRIRATPRQLVDA